MIVEDIKQGQEPELLTAEDCDLLATAFMEKANQTEDECKQDRLQMISFGFTSFAIIAECTGKLIPFNVPHWIRDALD